MASDTAAAIIKDVLPIPETTDSTGYSVADKMSDHPTDSHALARADHDEKGAAQQDHDEEVIDLGWNEDPKKIVNPLIGGLSNEDLWVLVRRFNKQMYHLKEVKTQVPGGLDLNTADNEEFSPDKLRANLERLYLTVIVGLAGSVNHIARLRSWRETRRTASFAVVYLIAWLLDLIVPVMSLFMVVLIVSPQARTALFPPAPLALVDKKTGGVQKPKSGVLASHDSLTGAPENMKGEAVEQEASNFVTGIATIALASSSGKHPQGEPEHADGESSAVPDPTALATGAAAAKEASAGGTKDAKKDKTKVPMESAMWNQIRPAMHIIGEICDTWERLGNALSPISPYNKKTYRVRLALIIAPIVIVSLFVTSYMFTKGAMFGAGFAFFGDPVMTPAIEYINRKFPNWTKILEPRNTILKGVPTNAQLTVTLLRIGEHSRSPLPPPPHLKAPPPDQPANLTDDHLRAIGGDYPLNATKEELDAAIAHEPEVKHETDGKDIEESKSTKHGKHGSRILNFFKGTTKAAVNTAIGTDTLRAKAGSKPAKNRLGVVPGSKETLLSGPVEFKCRFKGTKGHVYIYHEGEIPMLAFSTDKKIDELGTIDRIDQIEAQWKVELTQVAELKKVGGFGWKAKLVVGWALDKEVSDALEILCRNGEKLLITALPLRDELFNRACAIGGQKWESW